MSSTTEKLSALLSSLFCSPCEAMLALEKFLEYANKHEENMAEFQNLRAIGNRVYM